MHGHGRKSPVIEHAADRAGIASRLRNRRRQHGNAIALLGEAERHRDIVGRKPAAHVHVDRAFAGDQAPGRRTRHVRLKNTIVGAEIGWNVWNAAPRQIGRRRIQKPRGAAQTPGDQRFVPDLAKADADIDILLADIGRAAGQRRDFKRRDFKRRDFKRRDFKRPNLPEGNPACLQSAKSACQSACQVGAPAPKRAF